MPGVVHPRVLQRIVADGSFCEDQLSVEYLGGVLASSKCNESRDDRGTFLLDTVGSLSAYQLRTHYMLYAAMVRFGKPHEQNLSWWFEEDNVCVGFPESGYRESMKYSATEVHEDLAYHSFLGLEQQGLLKHGNRVIAERSPREPSCDFRYFWPTRCGYELFVWSLGLGQQRATSYFDIPSDINLPIEPPFRALFVQLGSVRYG